LGRKRCFTMGLAVYGVGALLSANSPGLGVLILGNSVLEGIGSAPVDPAGLHPHHAAVHRPAVAGAGVWPDQRDGRQVISWRAAFLLQTAVIAAIVLLSRKLVDPLPPDPTRPFDTVRAVLSAVGMLFVVVGILRAGSNGVLMVVLLAVGAAFLFWFFVHIRQGAVRAAREALGHDRLATPRRRGEREALRVLLTTRRCATLARVAAIGQLKALIVGAPQDLRAELRGRSTAGQIDSCAGLRARPTRSLEHRATVGALRATAQRIQAPGRRGRRVGGRAGRAGPGGRPWLLEVPGVGPLSAAQVLVSWSHAGRFRSQAAFAALAGTNPHPGLLRAGDPPSAHVGSLGEVDRCWGSGLHGTPGWSGEAPQVRL
jgi:hypothetical protein